MREKTGGRDLVRPGVTRFATAFLTLQSLYKHKDALRQLFVSGDWVTSKLANTEAGKKVTETVLSHRFWSTVEDCIRAAHPLIIVLRIVDGDEKPALPELAMAMKEAKKKICESFANNSSLLLKLTDIIQTRWEDQMEVQLYGAALFLNPSKYFDVKKDDDTYALQLRTIFNNVLMKMIPDLALRAKISDQADDYEEMRDNFANELTTMQLKTKNPLDWWRTFGGNHPQLYYFAIRILGLCCSASECERNWSTFEFIHTKKRNRLEHKRLNDLVYIQYNRKIADRFQRRREEGRNFNPLLLDEFQWDNEWVDKNRNDDDDVVHPGHDLSWRQVDEASGASLEIPPHNTRARGGDGGSSSSLRLYERRHPRRRSLTLIDEHIENENDRDTFPNDDEDVDDDDDGGDGSNDDNDATRGDHGFDVDFLDDY